ncbi:hypothetical protein AX774_g387 [Zancudomyces culisetae]|uniref:Uncharacterized protein n=1 Tax=Zancudomyces culisetae TaxID=1213189 RepID=A0A1R1PYR6_ZANCU|nr:hypothetical protein AX774_g387 [Zancudomyces culisetae]|eukprot:OMH86071.1 hypothetical protein AX774_g387 [Zancudomyces culisetae]
MDKLIARRKEVLNKLEKENAETAQLKVEIDESQKEYKKLVNEQNKLEGSVSELEKEHKRVEKEEVKLAETQKHLNSRLKKTEKKEDELRTQAGRGAGLAGRRFGEKAEGSTSIGGGGKISIGVRTSSGGRVEGTFEGERFGEDQGDIWKARIIGNDRGQV